MKRIGIVGLCLAAMFALSAMGASSAFAGEYGVCAKAAKSGKKYTGKYLDKNCTKAATEGEIAEGKKNKYEWDPYPGPAGTKWTYTSKSKTAILEGAAGDITCKASTDAGEVTGVKSDVDTTTFTGCILSVTKESCQNTATAGTIVTTHNVTTLIDHGETGDSGKEPKEGEVWTQYTGEGTTGPEGTLASWECSGIPFTTNGSLSGVTTEDVNVMSTKSKTTFNKEVGEQDLLTTFFNPFTSKIETGPAVENVTGEAKNAGKIEIKA
ncbi:MAG: hypothetical protein ACLPUT_11440 [Solirubrobacteraceae bacterium]